MEAEKIVYLKMIQDLEQKIKDRIAELESEITKDLELYSGMVMMFKEARIDELRKLLE